MRFEDLKGLITFASKKWRCVVKKVAKGRFSLNKGHVLDMMG